MHRPVIFLALATVALGATANVNVDAHGKNLQETPTTIPATSSEDFMNFSVLAARDLKKRQDVVTNEHKPITDEFHRRLDINAEALESKVLDADSQSGQDVDANTRKGIKLLGVDLHRGLDVDTNALGEIKPLNADRSRGLDVDVNVLRGIKPLDADHSRGLDVDVNVLGEINLDNNPLGTHKLSDPDFDSILDDVEDLKRSRNNKGLNTNILKDTVLDVDADLHRRDTAANANVGTQVDPVPAKTTELATPHVRPAVAEKIATSDDDDGKDDVREEGKNLNENSNEKDSHGKDKDSNGKKSTEDNEKSDEKHVNASNKASAAAALSLSIASVFAGSLFMWA
ncbi:hypothetical protein BG011_009333 [Mortierella polycephala]|uniref:Uncharacterized protein n=1 Tax=Mortierella polycephala TaxID=41804 RepID=A0A9P6PNC8_9FUNG|nr:hypothetical protein BG011_009333 [Mortierella polycephala]